MGRNSKRVALYEVISKNRLKSSQEKALNRERASGNSENKTEGSGSNEKKPAQWSVTPRPVRIYRDRIELCFSWQVGIVGVLAFLAIVLLFFRLGRISAPVAAGVPKVVKKQPIKPVKPAEPKLVSSRSAKIGEGAKMVEPMGDNVIVITSYGIRSHLEPVRRFFSGFGIETEIMKSGNRYLLVTRRRFDNPEKAGTDGFDMKKKIIAIGANYKPPAGSGFESFGQKPFHDAYGMKID